MSAPAPVVAVPVPAAGIDHLNSVVIPVFVGGRCRSDHDRSRCRCRSDHDRARFDHGADQINDVRGQTDSARSAMMMRRGRRPSEHHMRCGTQKSGGDSSDQE